MTQQNSAEQFAAFEDIHALQVAQRRVTPNAMLDIDTMSVLLQALDGGFAAPDDQGFAPQPERIAIFLAARVGMATDDRMEALPVDDGSLNRHIARAGFVARVAEKTLARRLRELAKKVEAERKARVAAGCEQALLAITASMVAYVHKKHEDGISPLAIFLRTSGPVLKAVARELGRLGEDHDQSWLSVVKEAAGMMQAMHAAADEESARQHELLHAREDEIHGLQRAVAGRDRSIDAIAKIIGEAPRARAETEGPGWSPPYGWTAEQLAELQKPEVGGPGIKVMRNDIPPGWKDADAALDAALNLLNGIGTENAFGLSCGLVDELVAIDTIDASTGEALKVQIRDRLAQEKQQGQPAASEPAGAEPMTAEEERGAFEGWALRHGLLIGMHPEGAYRNSYTAMAWGAWQARAVQARGLGPVVYRDRPAPAASQTPFIHDGGGHGGMHSGMNKGPGGDSHGF